MILLLKIIKILTINKSPIFIAGCGRSGTSLLLSVLSAHPNIYGIGEETNIFGSKRKFNNVTLNKINNCRKLFPYLLTDSKILTAKRWCEKTPRNIRFIDQIKEEFNSRAKIVHIIRDGRDVVTSIHPLTNEYHIPVERWVRDVYRGLKHKECKDVLTLRYEDLVLDLKTTIMSLLCFLGEEMHDNLSAFHLSTNVKTHKAFANGKVDEINTSSIGKWKDKKHKERIIEFYENKEAVELLEKIGYEV